MGKTIFLGKPGALASQVAEVLLRENRKDLSRVEVWIPTAGAGRRVRRALAEEGVLSPRFTQPMRALLPDGVAVAEPFEREAAWALALKRADGNFLEPLFSSVSLETDSARLRCGGVLCGLCDLLAEAGLSPAHAEVAEVCAGDSARWEVLGRLYDCYLAALKDCGLVDPNEARFAEIARPSRGGELRRLVVACVPDLPLAAQRYAEALESLGVEVQVLVWFPDGLEGGFDSWGRPLADEWAKCRIAAQPDQITVTRSPEDEARLALDFATSSKNPGDYAVVLADPKPGSAFRSEVEFRGGVAFLPEGSRLDLTEAGVIALEWPRFQSSGDLRVLRRLLELPRFNRVVRAGSGLRDGGILAACDFLIGEAVLSDFRQATAFAAVDFDPSADKLGRRSQSRLLVELLGAILKWDVPELLGKAWRSGGEGLEAAREVAALYGAISASPLSGDGGVLEHAFARAIKAGRVFESSESGNVELPGWLEAPWLEASRLAVCGCTEGSLPSVVNGHPFLPDSKRRALGLADNAARFARDAYLLQCLLIARPAPDFRCSFSRFDSDGSPALPSSLFLRCEQDALPERVLQLFADLPGAGNRPRRGNTWKWRLPENLCRKVEKISPTDFAQYLACPFRFYLRRPLWLDALNPDAREMDPKRFGTLVHNALEKFGLEAPHEPDPEKIERFVLGNLDEMAGSLFGPSPAPAVRVQIEAAKVRLKGFARIQAEQFAVGWRIVSVERKLEVEEGLSIGPLKLSGKIDRIERNDQTGAWRILDYKTRSKADPPAKKHFGPRLAPEWLPAAELEVPIGKRTYKKRWADLQLPLYRKILSHWHGSEIGGAPIVTAYFALPADPGDAAVLEFTELDEAAIASATECAEAVSALIHKGVFWPPQAQKSSWDDPFGGLFLHGKPEDCIAPETIAFLEGRG
ncbi:MAG: PD-(D/E)XK nuclease family protein [Verrucomicrobia bacterium]|nr:PD-(D/E)XK nuclease family protein [Verrucomicrobiota bacterium]